MRSAIVAAIVPTLFLGFSSLIAPTAPAQAGSGSPEWVQRITPTLPPAARAPQMVYDEARELSVVFGGAQNSQDGGGTWGETWGYDGTDWRQLHPGDSAGVSAPAPRAGHAMAYDSARQVIVLFGGGIPFGGGPQGDTWEWDGTSWTRVHAGDASGVSAPLPRTSPAMAFDESIGAVVLFGGFSRGAFPSDTWMWDGTSWTRAQGTGPVGRDLPAMAYDKCRQQCVMYGGANSSGVRGDTWVFDAGQWTEQQVTGPSPRRAVSMAWHQDAGYVVLFGGNDLRQGNFGTYFDDTWLWGGTGWSELSVSANVSSGRIKPGLAYDTARRVLVLAGGTIRGDIGFSDTWELVDLEPHDPPTLSCSVSETTLWPPRHDMRSVRVVVVQSGACGTQAAPQLLVSSDEPDDAHGGGDGHTTGDVNGSDGYASPVAIPLTYSADDGGWITTVQLRAERSGQGDGRTYSIRATTPHHGRATTSATREIRVPHSR